MTNCDTVIEYPFESADFFDKTTSCIYVDYVLFTKLVINSHSSLCKQGHMYTVVVNRYILDVSKQFSKALSQSNSIFLIFLLEFLLQLQKGRMNPLDSVEFLTRFRFDVLKYFFCANKVSVPCFESFSCNRCQSISIQVRRRQLW